jgi:predicted Zn-dependent protease
LSNAGISKAVDSAIAAAELLPPDDQMLQLPMPPGSEEYLSVARFDAATASVTAQERAAQVKKILDISTASNLRASGVYATGTLVTSIGNSNGLFSYHQQTSAGCSVTMETLTSSGWSKSDSVFAKDIDVEHLANKAARNAKLSEAPIDLPPGRHTVILTPSAVLDLICFLWHDFSATSHRDKMSSLVDKQGQQVFGENIDIFDDCSHPLQAGAPFDGEGMPRKKVTLVEKGVFRNQVFGRRMAKEYERESTGHGLREPNPEGEMPLNLVVGSGNSSLTDMIQTTDRGIFVSRVWYVRLVDPASILLTGMTRDGTFLIEGGELKQGILNLRFNISVIELLNSVISLGPAVRAAGEEGFPAVVPAMKVANFNFSSVARH